MKALKKIVIVLAVLNMSTWLASNKAQAQMTVNFQVFYDQLSPYGEWVNYPEYGYVWVPNVEAGFTPYSSDGRWEFSNYGWTWVSDYNWGWAPFHYGRWLYDNYYGWVWVPGNEWSPAWVCWRESAGYYGWAPLGPGFDINIGFGFSNYYRIPYNCWTFVPVRYIDNRYINRYYVNRSNNVTIINNTTIINNIHIDRKTNNNYFVGPNRNEVERNTGREVKPVVVQNSVKPGQSFENGKLNLYRPRVTASSNTSNVAVAPAHVMKRDEITPVSLRGTNNFQNNKSFENSNDNKSVASVQGGNVIRRTSANDDDMNANNNVQINRGQIQKVNQSKAISGNAVTQSAINNRRNLQNAQPVIQQSRNSSDRSLNVNSPVQQSQSRNSAVNQSRSFQNNINIGHVQQNQSSGSDRVQSTQKPHFK